ncbi:MAG: retropepsin-like domain-containing protein, partial [Candidatus Eremiobacteraeota bacterium]|nr:retropepsin-like domain-containing protein [Candidatus Eremiobacteraeota bacterium]
GMVFDTRVARALNLQPEGSLELRGAARTAALGVVQTPDVEIGGVTIPSHIATVVDLSSIVRSNIALDGIIGFPLFAGAELRFDPDAHTVTIAKPGSLAQLGTKFDVDTDRELPELTASADMTPARFVVDTGNANEVLLFRSFMDAHPGLISFAGHGFIANRGVGGSAAAVGATLDDLTIGPYHFYNCNANVMLATGGAFADRTDGGNIGFGVLQNFVMTFDLSHHALFLEKARRFDDGRGRPVQ